MTSGGEATVAAIAELQGIDLLDRGSQLVLQAVSHTGEPSIRAFKAWRALSTLDDADYKHHRAMPLLAALAAREKIEDPDMARMRGVGRHLWTSNTLKLNVLFKALDALNSRGITPLLQSGAALFVRVPEMIRQRALGELEILIHPHQLKAAGEALAAHGFISLAPSVVVLGRILVGGEGAELRIQLADHAGEVTLRCQPLPDFLSRRLAEVLWQDSVQQTLQGRQVRVPTASHQLFCAIARCEPWDQVECFTRLLDATVLLSVASTALDWGALAQLVCQLGLEEAARSFLAVLARDTEYFIPDAFFEDTAKRRTAAGRKEWQIRARQPRTRKWHELRLLSERGCRYDRAGHWGAPEPRIEMALRLFWPGIFSLHYLWMLAARRVLPHAPQFSQRVAGVSSPNLISRKAQGHWSIVNLPLSEVQKAGEPLSLDVVPFLPNSIVNVVASGGRATVRCTVTGVHPNNIDIAMLPVEKLGGNGLVLMRVVDLAGLDPRAHGCPSPEARLHG